MTGRNLTAKILSAIDDLPSLNPVWAKFSQIVADPASSAAQVSDIVRLDPALSVKVLRLANSAYVGIPRTTNSLKNAVVLLGQKRIFSLALTTSVVSSLNKRGLLPFSHREYWRHSVGCAMIAESVAKFIRRRDFIDSDEVFTAGLLHDIGKLAGGCFIPESISDSVRESQKRNVPFFKGEQLETSHTTIGWILAKKWNFPEELCDAIAHHHDIAIDTGNRKVVSLVHMADYIAHLVNFSTIRGEMPPDLNPDAITSVNVFPERLRTIADEALLNEKKIESFIDCIM
jgi:putative nucleotidyltransferase with HDIG domain